jgi:hypothetical protein
VTALGLLVFSRLQTGSSVIFVELGFVPLVASMAITMTPLTTLIMSSVPLGRAGVGSAMNDTTREVGGALGVAVLGSLVTTRFTAALRPAVAGLPANAQHAANTGLAGALGVASRTTGAAGDALAHAAKAAFVAGIGVASLAAAGVVFATAIVAHYLLPAGTDTGPPSPADDADFAPTVAPAPMRDHSERPRRLSASPLRRGPRPRVQ